MMLASFSHGRSLAYSAFLGTFLSLLAGSVSVIYHYLQDPKFHQNAYALLTVVVLFRSFFMMERHIRDVDPISVNRMWRLVISGITIFLSGFVVWNLDNAFCGNLRGWRRAVGLPWGLLAEGHGWWHLLTGIGAYYELQYGIFLRHCLDGRQDEYILVWDGVFCLPEVVRRPPGVANRKAVNGGAKMKKVQ
jgi:dihydroceramidase